MNQDLGVFALWQVLASAVIIGPILLLIGLFSRQQRRRSNIYITLGALLTLLGAFCLYQSMTPHNLSEESPELQESKG